MKYKYLLLFFSLAIIFGCDKQGEKWKISRQQDTIEGYQDLIAEHPESIYADSARHAINVIKYKLARSENTIQAFEYFLGIVPDSTLAEKARSDIQTIQNDRAPAFQQVRTIFWNAEALNADGNFVLHKARHTLQQLFNPSDIEFVNSKLKKYDAQILITTRGNALGAYYRPFNNKEAIPKFSCTGAEASIKLEIKAPKDYNIKKSYHGKISPSEMNVGTSNKAKDAPWEKVVIESGFYDNMVEIVNNILGPTGLKNCLLKQTHLNNHLEEQIKSTLENSGVSINKLAIDALRDYKEKMRCRGIELLESQNDTICVPILITVLKTDKSINVRSKACDALGLFYKQCPFEIALNALKDSSDVRRNAIHILEKKKDHRAIRPLIFLLKDKSTPVKLGASWALQVITGQNFEKDHPYHHMWSDRDKFKYWCQWLQEHQDSFN